VILPAHGSKEKRKVVEIGPALAEFM